MPTINNIGNIKALVYLNLIELKNNMKLTFTNPFGVMVAVFKVLMPVITIIWIPMMLNLKDVKGRLLSFHMPANIVSAIIMFLLMVIFFINLIKAVENYYPTHYAAADVNFLFTSPISSRLIYAWSLIKQIGKALLGSLFMALPLFLTLRISNIMASVRGIIYALAGVVVFIIIVQTLKFFFYSVSKRFNMATLVKTLVYVSFGIVAIYFIISLVGSVDILQRALEVVGGKEFDSIPVIGWTKNLILSPFNNSIPVTSLIMLVLFATLMLFITIYLATDYYEETIVSTEKMAKIRAAFTGNNIEEVQRLTAKKKVKVKRVHLHWNLKKAYAFLWKATVIHQRKSKGMVAEIVKYVFFAIVGGVLGYVFRYVYRNHAYRELIVFVVVLSTILKKSNASLLEGLEYELKKNYIFLLPGRVRDKMLAINIIPVIKTLVRNLVIISSMALFLKVNLIQLLSLWVILSAVNLMNLFTTAVIKVILPFEDNKNMLLVILRYGVETLMELPAAGMGILTYFLFKNIEAAVFVFGICSLFTVIWLLHMNESFI